MKSIGKYQVVEQLGTSATGTTYKVRDSFRKQEFALKILRTVPSLTAAAKEQFCAYLASCAELVHRHVVKVHDLGEVEEGIFVVSELRPGIDLQRYMQQNRDLPIGQKLALIAQVAEGLAFAHSREIAHGNLKPSNVIVDGERDITILDFGVAKWLAALLDAGSRPEGLVVNYLAPEQVLGQPFDARSDIFALGLMLYEFVSGKYPFSASPSLIPREIVHSEVEPLRHLDQQVPEELSQLVQRALQKDPAQRLQTAEEFAAGLYLAAQELRRRASAAAQVEPPVESPAMESPVVEAPRFTPPLITEPAPPRAAEQPARERPQDETGPPQPWTARSYAANAPLTKEMPAMQPAMVTTETPPKSAPPPVTEVQLPAFSPPPPPRAPVLPRQAVPQQSVAWPSQAAPPVKNNTTKRKALVLVAGLILAAGIVGSLVSRQGLRASQNKKPAAAVTQPSVPPAPADQSRQAATAKTPKPAESGPDDLGNPEFSAKQTLNGPVRSLWESGRYGEALALVNQVLANDPNNGEARSWKKRVRDAQQAEAALK